jgi:predicted Zn-dependent peptidase
MMEIHTLKNGIRIAHAYVPTTRIVHCGLMLDIGSRDETHANQGIAHFWEHMAFKGTRKRNAFHILNRLESLGGELNAFTDKEKILFYASLRDTYFERALELLADITFDSVFPESQIERERNVILEEMAMYHDDPEDTLQDEFDRLVFAKHSLGMNILGREKTVQSFRRSDFKKFIKDHLDTRKIIFSCAGNITFDAVVKLTEQYLGGVNRAGSVKKRIPFRGYKPQELTLHREVKQARCAMGLPAYRVTDERRSAFFMLSNILGGPGMNSRLNLALRERRGFVYSIGAQYVPFTDTGLFVISFGTEPSQMKKSLTLINRELTMLKEDRLGAKQLRAAKEQIMGQLAIARENNTGLMMMMARNLLDHSRLLSLDELFDRIQYITADDLRNIAVDIFREEKFSYLFMEPPSHGLS